MPRQGQGVDEERFRSAVGRSWYSTAQRALDGTHAVSWAAIGLTFAGWFLFDTLHVAWGPLERSVPFYDLAVVIDSPVRLFTGVEGHRGAGTVILTSLCWRGLLVASLAHFWRGRRAWMFWSAPAALMLVVALVLYARVSDDPLIARLGAPDTIGSDLRHLSDASSAASTRQRRSQREHCSRRVHLRFRQPPSASP